MNDCISRAELLKEFEPKLALYKEKASVPVGNGLFRIDENRSTAATVMAYVVSLVRDATAVKPEVPHGRWILEREPDGTPYCFHCSVCDDDFHHIGIMTAYNYCPNCGARMDGGADE